MCAFLGPASFEYGRKIEEEVKAIQNEIKETAFFISCTYKAYFFFYFLLFIFLNLFLFTYFLMVLFYISFFFQISSDLFFF